MKTSISYHVNNNNNTMVGFKKSVKVQYLDNLHVQDKALLKYYSTLRYIFAGDDKNVVENFFLINKKYSH